MEKKVKAGEIEEDRKGKKGERGRQQKSVTKES